MDMKKEYYEDIQPFKDKARLLWFGVLVVFLSLYPLLVKNYYVYLANLIAIHILVAVGLNLLVGYTGQISLGHAGFFAIGAYTAVLFMKDLQVPFILALLSAGVISAAFGFILGLPALRLKGPYLAIATLGFGMAIIQIIGHWEGLFGGHMGILTPEITLFSLALDSDIRLYYLVITITVILTLGARNLVNTRVGRAFIAIRDSDVAAEAIGVNLTSYKTLSFAVSAFYTGVAGGLYAIVLGFINPGSFNLILSIFFLGMIVVGGLGSIPGSVLGAILLTLLQLKLNNITEIPTIGPFLNGISKRWFSVSGVQNISSIIIGLIMITIIIFEPLGLYGLWNRLKRYWKSWPF